jgi:hypothetical protein
MGITHQLAVDRHQRRHTTAITSVGSRTQVVVH